MKPSILVSAFFHDFFSVSIEIEFVIWGEAEQTHVDAPTALQEAMIGTSKNGRQLPLIRNVRRS